VPDCYCSDCKRDFEVPHCQPTAVSRCLFTAAILGTFISLVNLKDVNVRFCTMTTPVEAKLGVRSL